jgi:hypothetical protein
VPSTSRQLEHWSAADKLAAVIQDVNSMLEHALKVIRTGREELIGIIEVDLHGTGRPLAQRSPCQGRTMARPDASTEVHGASR